MSSRRRFLQSLAGSAALPFLPLRSFARPLEITPSDDFPQAGDPRFWEKVRTQFYLREDEVFFNTGTLGSSPKPVIEAVANSMRTLAATIAEWDYKPDQPNWFTGYYTENPFREKLAKLINCDLDEIALTQNATMGMNIIAHGLDLRHGDEVIQTDQEHPGARCGYEVRVKRDGIVWKTVKMPVPANDPDEIVELVKAAITPATKVIAWPHIVSLFGTVMPVKKICALARERNLFTVIDGAQAVGHVKVDVRDIGCDAYFSSPHKWLLAPAGNGLLYVRKEVAPKIWTVLASSAWDDQKDPGYRMQQRGTGNLSLLVGLDASIDFFNRVGADRWIGRIKQLGDYLRSGLQKMEGVKIYSSTHPEMCAGITTWGVVGMTGEKMQDYFWEKGRLRPRSMGNDYGVRQSTCIYNNEQEIDRTLALAQEMVGMAVKKG
jgi:selenocysteine lyase/cysteine desulfurase